METAGLPHLLRRRGTQVYGHILACLGPVSASEHPAKDQSGTRAECLTGWSRKDMDCFGQSHTALAIEHLSGLNHVCNPELFYF